MWMLAAAAVGTAFSTYNSYQSLKASRQQALEQQALRIEEAGKIADAYKANLAVMEQKGRQEIESLSGGRASFFSSSKNLKSMASAYSNMLGNLENLKKQGEYEVSMRLREADLAGNQASAYNRAVFPTVLGGSLEAGAKGAASYGAWSNPKQ